MSIGWRTRRSHNVLPVPALQQFPLARLRLVGLWGETTTKWWCAICGERCDWREPNRLLVVQPGEGFEQAKVFKAHAVPQWLFATWINALKLLANQQEDGDGLQQNIVTNLGKRSRKGLTDGLCELIRVERALYVERYAEAQELLKFGCRKVPEGARM